MMYKSKRGLSVSVLLIGLGLTVLGCSQSDRSSGAANSAGTPNTPSAAAPPASMPGPSAAAPPASMPGPSAPPSSSAAAPSATALTMEAAGQVVSADPTTKTLVVKSDTGPMTFEVQDRSMTELQGLKPGDKVTVQYTEDAGKNRVEAIHKG